MNRRQFLTRVGLLGAAAAIAPEVVKAEVERFYSIPNEVALRNVQRYGLGADGGQAYVRISPYSPSREWESIGQLFAEKIEEGLAEGIEGYSPDAWTYPYASDVREDDAVLVKDPLIRLVEYSLPPNREFTIYHEFRGGVIAHAALYDSSGKMLGSTADGAITIGESGEVRFHKPMMWLPAEPITGHGGRSLE